MPLAGALYLWIFLFHMPAFAFVMGHVSRLAGPSASSPRRLVTRLLLPYLSFNVLYLGLERVLPGREVSVDFSVPYWLTWFLLSVFWWRLLLPVFAQLRFPVATSIGISLIAGMAPAVGAPFAASRTLALLPFFVLGATLRTDQVIWRGHRVGRAAGLAVLALAGVVAWQLQEVLASSPTWLYWNVGYADQHYDLWSGVAVRGLMIAVGVLLTSAFLLVVPRVRTGYTVLGAFVAYAYLLHGPVVLIYRQTALPDMITGPWQVGVLVLLAAALGVGCMHPWVRRMARPLIQPELEWLFVRTRQPDPESTPVVATLPR